ncbi:MAG: hypothetical protein Greene041619_760 [Candidatus Peregrinibacteria bacterium Greene0416_19]|nr:MAG: hypothetical protein Greene041619_760 [Candidatus Peregrinibacteria bacterium Greene0416_19]
MVLKGEADSEEPGGVAAMMGEEVGPETDDDGGAMVKEEPAPADAGATSQEDGPMMEAGADASGVYHADLADFSSSVLTDGKSKILFFAAAWCPKCRAHDVTLARWYQTESFPVSVYKIDYDAASALKATYGVVQQHTFVKVDGQGKLIKSVSFPTDEGLMAFLQG